MHLQVIRMVTESLKLVMDQEEITLSELMETRRLLEVEIAGVAAERATEEGLLRLRKTLDMGKVEHSDLEKYADLDIST